MRHFQQRAILYEHGKDVQLLVKPEVVHHYMRFDQILRQLQRLGARRRLFGMERYRAVQLMGLLTLYCYEEGGAAASSRHSYTSRRSASTALNPADQSAGVYLLLVGRATATIGSDTLVMLPDSALIEENDRADMPPPMPFPPIYDEPSQNPCNRQLRRGDRVVIEGVAYKVKATEEVLSTDTHGTRAPALSVTLDRPIRLELASGLAGVAPTPPALQATGTGPVWVMLECRSPAMNVDCQLLLLNMGAHEVAIQLLKLPFHLGEVLASELEVRAVCLACYRLIKAMAIGCPKAQLALVPSLAGFVAMTSAQPSALVTVDVSPIQCIQTIYDGNRTVCAQVEEATVRRFVELASDSHAPRFLRFLRGLMRPGGRPIKRNQTLVVNCLDEKETALVFYADVAGRGRRDALVAAEDHLTHPHGELQYHIELMALLGEAAMGQSAAAEMQVARTRCPHQMPPCTQRPHPDVAARGPFWSPLPRATDHTEWRIVSRTCPSPTLTATGGFCGRRSALAGARDATARRLAAHAASRDGCAAPRAARALPAHPAGGLPVHHARVQRCGPVGRLPDAALDAHSRGAELCDRGAPPSPRPATPRRPHIVSALHCYTSGD